MDKEYAIKLISEYVNKLKINNISIQSAYLFGSFAKGENTVYSDIDLAIVMDKVLNKFETEVKLMTLRKNDETIIEPHVFQKDEFNRFNPLINEILNTGIQINI